MSKGKIEVNAIPVGEHNPVEEIEKRIGEYYTDVAQRSGEIIAAHTLDCTIEEEEHPARPTIKNVERHLFLVANFDSHQGANDRLEDEYESIIHTAGYPRLNNALRTR